ncbi:Transcriptional regulator, Crp/Fnr family [Candidatus Zixiibacteriota bacterium]|nr:Transcriptional regulator, Crp/Fnr family [candidate division Zixibacteria bacterium]
METLEPLLAGHPFLKGMDLAHIKLLVGCATNAVYKPGEFIFREGEDANHFYIVREGKVSVETFAPVRGPIPIHTIGKGEVLGWSWLLPPYHWHFDARAFELTRVIALDGECLRKKCDDDLKLGYELFKRFAVVIAERLEGCRLQLIDMYGKNS